MEFLRIIYLLYLLIQNMYFHPIKTETIKYLSRKPIVHENDDQKSFAKFYQ